MPQGRVLSGCYKDEQEAPEQGLFVVDRTELRNAIGFAFHASVIDDRATPLTSIVPPKKLGLLLGSEANGLSEEWQEWADQRVTIPMDGDTDSLNVAVAAGIFMHHYRKR